MILRAVLGLALGLCVGLFLAPASRAEDTGMIAVRGIDVDVTAGNAVDAREKAVLQGQRKGLRQALLMLAPSANVDQMPPLSDSQITDLVADYDVESEQTSTVRYSGKLTFRYRLDGLTALLQQNGIGAATTPSPPVLLLPVMVSGGKNILWEDGNAWRAAWASHPPSTGLVPIMLPKGDAADTAAITADQAASGDMTKIQALAAHYGVGDVAVAILRSDPASQALAINVVRYSIAGPSGGFQDQLTPPAGSTTTPDTLYAAAIDRIADHFQQDWIAQNQVSSSIEQRLTVDAPVNGLAQWAELRRRLASIATLHQVDVVYLMQTHAELDLVFIGDRDQLTRALAQRALILKDTGDGHTSLELAGAQP
jgi:hypothetical protein